MAPPFPLSDKATDVRPGCKTQKIAPMLRQVADLVCDRCIVGHVNACLSVGLRLNAHRYELTLRGWKGRKGSIDALISHARVSPLKTKLTRKGCGGKRNRRIEKIGIFLDPKSGRPH
ncbi:hypothetical protein PoB_001438600 [Plakobranchus ocellatus]|uniref:Uncharacterized protein n=1 Tax=Plakobranchus ocellatus TaxID=259542 RepID=A0AAV3YZX4_9GAST|nr:hypothetical protein PoB_001438600 [Plakobranchus ocellatus]